METPKHQFNTQVSISLGDHGRPSPDGIRDEASDPVLGDGPAPEGP